MKKLLTWLKEHDHLDILAGYGISAFMTGFCWTLAFTAYKQHLPVSAWLGDTAWGITSLTNAYAMSRIYQHRVFTRNVLKRLMQHQADLKRELAIEEQARRGPISGIKGSMN